MYCLQVFGVKRNPLRVLPLMALLSLFAAVPEELLFRGALMGLFTALWGPIVALVLTSVLFGIGHSPVPGASAITESLYGAVFGLVYLASGGNLFMVMLSHFCYDFATFLEVHNRAVNEFNRETEKLPERRQRVRELCRDYGLTEGFFRDAQKAFKLLDADGSGGISKREFKLAARTLTGSNWLGLDGDISRIVKEADTDQDGQVQFDEYFNMLVQNGVKKGLFQKVGAR
ncbi:unnamed protein product [Chrysoparadoxa australica]